jgi:hypothetical protein
MVQFRHAFERDLWDDLRFPFVGQQIDTSAGRIDYDFDECGVTFAANARYPEEPICMVLQMQHRMELSTNLRPHLHWMQQGEAIPNWMIEYRVYDNGETPPAFAQAMYVDHMFVYIAGTILQITTFPEIDMSTVTGVSGFVDIRFFRDSTNASLMFKGADPSQIAELTKEFDVHYLSDSAGSAGEYTK